MTLIKIFQTDITISFLIQNSDMSNQKKKSERKKKPKEKQKGIQSNTDANFEWSLKFIQNHTRTNIIVMLQEE